MTDLSFQVQSLSSAGSGRVTVNLVQVNAPAPSPEPGTFQAPGSGVPFYSSTLGLNLSQEEAAAFEVNSIYTMTLTQASGDGGLTPA